MEYVDWLTGSFVILFGFLFKVILGLRAYEKRMDKLEMKLEYHIQENTKSMEIVQSDLKEGGLQREKLGERLEQIAVDVRKIAVDMAFVRGQQEQRKEGYQEKS